MRAILTLEAAGDAAWERGWMTAAREAWNKARVLAARAKWSAVELRLWQRLLAADRIDEAITKDEEAPAAWPTVPAADAEAIRWSAVVEHGPRQGIGSPQDGTVSDPHQRETQAIRPVVTGGLVLWNSGVAVHALGLAEGRPAWAADSVLFPRGVAAGWPAVRGDRPRLSTGGICVAAGRCFATIERGGKVPERPDDSPLLACLDLSDAAEGRLSWAVMPPPTGGDRASAGTAFDGPPAADCELCLVVVRGRDPRGLLELAAFDARDGSRRWVRPLGPSAAADGIDHARGVRAACLAEDKIVIATHAGTVAAFFRDGRAAWKTDTAPAARVSGGGASGGGAAAEIPVGSRFSPAVFSRGRIFVAPRDRGGVVALDARDGRILWATGRTTDGSAEPGTEIVGATSRHLVVQVAGGRRGDGTTGGPSLRLLAADSGRESARRNADDGAAGTGLVVGGTLFWPVRSAGQPADAGRTLEVHPLDAGTLRPLAPPLVLPSGIPPAASPSAARAAADAPVHLAVGSGTLVVADGRRIVCLDVAPPTAPPKTPTPPSRPE